MNKQSIQIIVASVLSLILVFLLFGQTFSKRSQSRRTQPADSYDTAAEIFRVFDDNLTYLARKEIDDSLERIMTEQLQEGWKRNPFEILVSTRFESEVDIEEHIDVDEPEFDISGIVFEQATQDSSVIINGELYRIGDTIEGWTIVAIENEQVIFKSDDAEYIFNLYLTEE